MPMFTVDMVVKVPVTIRVDLYGENSDEVKGRLDVYASRIIRGERIEGVQHDNTDLVDGCKLIPLDYATVEHLDIVEIYDE